MMALFALVFFTLIVGCGSRGNWWFAMDEPQDMTSYRLTQL
jgi:hypothetical protein